MAALRFEQDREGLKGQRLISARRWGGPEPKDYRRTEQGIAICFGCLIDCNDRDYAGDWSADALAGDACSWRDRDCVWRERLNLIEALRHE
jgi:hypothetical protein